MSDSVSKTARTLAEWVDSLVESPYSQDFFAEEFERHINAACAARDAEISNLKMQLISANASLEGFQKGVNDGVSRLHARLAELEAKKLPNSMKDAEIARLKALLGPGVRFTEET